MFFSSSVKSMAIMPMCAPLRFLIKEILKKMVVVEINPITESKAAWHTYWKP